MNNYQLSNKVLSEALKWVPKYGFSNDAYQQALKQLNIPHSAKLTWPRGFPIALAEHAIRASTITTHETLESKYSKNALVHLISKNREAFIANKLVLPKTTDVIEDALYTKVKILSPYSTKWHEAVTLEYLPSNIPYAIISLAEFADVTAYHVERIENLTKLIEPLRNVLIYKSKAQLPESNVSSDINDFILSFLQGLPLSSGPHVGGLVGQLEWSLRRAKIGSLYCCAMASLMGDKSSAHIDTRTMIKDFSKVLF